MTADLSRLDSRLQRRLVTLRDGYEKRFVELVAALPLPAATDRSLWRLQLLGALNWTPTWYRPGGSRAPAEIARAMVAAVRYLPGARLSRGALACDIMSALDARPAGTAKPPGRRTAGGCRRDRAR